MDIRRGMFQVEHFRNSTRARLLLERVRSLEGSAGEFHAGRRVFWESALRHLHSHYPYPFPCRSESFSFPPSLSRSFSTSFLLPHPFTIPLQSIAAAKRGAKDGFRYRKGSGVEFPRLYSRRELYGISQDSNVLRYRTVLTGASMKVTLSWWTL